MRETDERYLQFEKSPDSRGQPNSDSLKEHQTCFVLLGLISGVMGWWKQSLRLPPTSKLPQNFDAFDEIFSNSASAWALF